MARRPTIPDSELGNLTHDRLTRDVWVYQREKGHRFSVDDVATAYVAALAFPDARRVLDLGCGLGSVLLTLAWAMPQAEFVGIEAQEMSFALLKRNVEGSGFASRVRIVHGDLREPQAIASLGTEFELITGTPPYFPPSTALDAEDPQRAYARIEYRGGVEAYVCTGATLLAPRGRLVVCGDARAGTRVAEAASAANLTVVGCCEVVPRAGAEPLFSIWTLAHTADPNPKSLRLVLRDSRGDRTADAQRLRQFSGF